LYMYLGCNGIGVRVLVGYLKQYKCNEMFAQEAAWLP